MQVLLVCILLLGRGIDLLGQLLQFFLGAFALGAGNLTLHLLDLEVSVVEQLLLAGLLMFELGDVRLQVARS